MAESVVILWWNLQLVIRLFIRVRVSLISEQFRHNTTQDRGDAPMAPQASALPREFFYNVSPIPDPVRRESDSAANRERVLRKQGSDV